MSNEKGETTIALSPSEIKSAWLWHPRNVKGVIHKRAIDFAKLKQAKGVVKLAITVSPEKATGSFEDVFKTTN